MVRDAASWVEGKKVAGLKLEVVRLPGRTPVIFFEVPATKAGSTDTICLYGHLDKQPEFNGWRNDLGPWTPKYENGLLYGRGGADDGYAVYAAITAIQALDAQGIPRPRCVGLIESCEESGSFDLPAYIDAADGRAWATWPGRLPRQRRRQLRPALAHHQPARHRHRHAEGRDPHRGRALGRFERPGAVELPHPAPGARPARGLARPAACCRRASTARSRPTASRRRAPPRRSSATRSGSASPGPAAPTAARRCRPPPTRSQALLNRTWQPTLSVTGVDGFPELKNAGNVLRPYTAFKLSACACRRWSTATRPPPS